MKENTFYAWIYLTAKDRETRIDSRPSDALALALRTDAPIYVNEKVIMKVKRIEDEEQGEIREHDEKDWSSILETFSREDFRQYVR